MPSYQEEIAALRQQRAAVEHAQSAQEIQRDYAQVKAARDAALERGDPEDWHEYDRECESLERTWQMYYAPRPQPPQADPRVTYYLNKKKAFIDRHGQAAINAMGLAHQYAVAPKNPGTNKPSGMGLRGGSREYFEAMDSLLDLYAKDYGLQHDPKEDSLTADEAARISGLSPDEYNGGVRRMYAEGRNSAAENAANGSRKVG